MCYDSNSDLTPRTFTGKMLTFDNFISSHDLRTISFFANMFLSTMSQVKLDPEDGTHCTLRECLGFLEPREGLCDGPMMYGPLAWLYACTFSPWQIDVKGIITVGPVFQ